MRGVELSKELGAPAEQLVDLARAELGEMSDKRRAEGFLTLKARQLPRRSRARLVLGLVAVLAIVPLVVVGWQFLGPSSVPALSYALEGGRIDSNGAFETTGTARPTLRFSDGTEVVFVVGAHGRVKSVGPHGARVSLNGRADVAVVPWQESQWLFDAGPFLIRVTGTTFTVDWRAADERLEIILKTGSVSVSGPLSDGAITLRAGQRLTISAREKEVTIRSIDPTAETNAQAADGVGDGRLADPEPSPSAMPVQSPTPSSAASPPTAASPLTSNWTVDLAAGRFATILQQAEQRGLDAVLAEGSADDLAALSDAARYSRRDDVARRALVAQRRRFPRSARANDAAFLLGRLEETVGHPEAALDWYQRCLDESPNGTYTPEALGRKMTVVQRLHGAARARPLAEEYLRRFGNGTYAEAARALLRTP